MPSGHGWAPTWTPDLRRLDDLGVVVHEEVLNRDHHDYVHANTIYSMCWAEEFLDAEVIVWCDSDKVFLSEPSFRSRPRQGRGRGDRPLLPRCLAGRRAPGPGILRPLLAADVRTRGSHGGAIHDCARRGLRVRAFWNGGLIVFRRSAGLARQWLSFFEQMLEVGHVPEYGILNVDQLTLAAILTAAPTRSNSSITATTTTSPSAHAFRTPIARTSSSTLSASTTTSGSTVRASLRTCDPPSPDSDRYLWLQGFLPLEPTNTKPLRRRLRSARG